MDYEGMGIPVMWAICPECEGDGHVENPAFSNGFTSSEFYELFDDEQSREDYFAGAFDVCCPECKGSGKVREPKVSACNYAQKRILVKARKEAREDAQEAYEAAILFRAESGYQL